MRSVETFGARPTLRSGGREGGSEAGEREEEGKVRREKGEKEGGVGGKEVNG